MLGLCSLIFTLYTYVQQGCVWSCQFVYIFLRGQKLAVWGLTVWKFPVGVIHCLLIEFNHQKGAYYIGWFVQRKKFGSILLMGRKKCFPANCITLSHASSTCNAASYAMLFECKQQKCSADLQYWYRYSLYWQCLVCTCRVCVLWNSSSTVITTNIGRQKHT